MKRLLFMTGFMSAFNGVAQTTHEAWPVPGNNTGAYSYRFADLFSVKANQAALARMTHFAAGASTDKKFGLTGLGSYTLIIGIPIARGGGGVIASYSGSAAYNESQAGIGYGKQLGNIDLGIQFNYTMLRVAGYGSAGAAGMELGTIWHISQRLHTGIQLVNPAGGKFGKQATEKLAYKYTAGIGYEVSEQVLLSMEIIKEEDRPVNVHAGVQYILAGQLYARAGITTMNTSPYAGAGWGWGHLRVFVSGSYHPQLGFTPALSLIVQQQKQAKP